MKTKKLINLILIVFFTMATTSAFAGPPSGYKLVWADEFNDNNLGKWNKDASNDWDVNGKKCVYRSDNWDVAGGKLYMKCRYHDRNATGYDYSGVDLNTKGKYDFTYGYIEAKIKMNHNGTNYKYTYPTFWIYRWQKMEFDIMEFAHPHLNNPVELGVAKVPKKQKIYAQDLNFPADVNGWHTWGVLWSPNEVKFFVDGKLAMTYNDPALCRNQSVYLKLTTSPHLRNIPPKSGAYPELVVDWVRVYKVDGGSSTSAVHMKKRNAMGYAVDGGNGGTNGQSVKIWSQNPNNVNQQWVEIDRGGGYYSFQKKNTNFCMDGGNGGKNGQDVYLWTCSAGNQNQHWKKVNMGSGNYRLEKRNASAYSIDGGNGGSNGQNLYLWSSNNGNQNQHWNFSSLKSGEIDNVTTSDNIQVYPNPASELVNIRVDNTEKAETTMKMYNINGVNVMDKVIPTGTICPLNVSHLSKGIYIIVIDNKTQQIEIN